MSSEARGIGPSLARTGLHACSYAYGLAMSARNVAFDLGLKATIPVEVPVIGIGNLTTGGTGKTPVVATVVQILQAAGHQPGIVSRGYRADESGENDEKKVLALKCPGVPHEQNPDRIAACLKLMSDHAVSVIVLDDAFQHRRIHRDLNIVLIDATNPFGYDYLLPRGLLRESMSGLRRADLVLVTRADAVSEDQLQSIRERCVRQDHRLEQHIHDVRFRPTVLLNGNGETQPVENLSGESVVVMTGIGNPEAFISTCLALNFDIKETALFPDHHHFTVGEVREVIARAGNQNATIVTTVKDLVKIEATTAEVWAVDIDVQFEDESGRQSVSERIAAY